MRTDLDNFLLAAHATAPVWAFILLCFGIAALFVYAEDRADRQRRTRRDLNAATMHHVTRCGARSPEGWFCDRDREHDGYHVDSTKGSRLGSARWFDGRAA